MGRALWLMDILNEEFRGDPRFRVNYVDGWETRGKSTFNPKGIINHHTGRGGYSALLNYMAHNSSIAPLCNIATSRPINSVVQITVVASGKANHAGRGYLPWTGTNMGNTYTVGFENQNDGTQRWPEQQNEGIARANAAVLKYIGQGVDRLADHKTYAPTRKVDRVYIDLGEWKKYVDTFMKEATVPTEPVERKYTMVIYGQRGTPDFNAATAAVDMLNKGVATSNLEEAKAAVQRGEKVVAVGGPAVRALGFKSQTGSVYVDGNKVAVRGTTGLETMKLLAEHLM